MIVHTSIAKLYKHLHEPEFSRLMRQIEAAQEEGLDSYELDVHPLDDDMRLDLLAALETTGHDVIYDTEREMFEVAAE